MSTRSNTGTGPDAPFAPPKPTKPATYVKGSHAAGVRADHDKQRVELLSLRDVLTGQRDTLNDQIEDIGDALSLLSDPGTRVANIVPIRQAGE